MNVLELIKKKLTGQELNFDEIQFIVQNYSNDLISEEDMGVLVKVYHHEGMTEKETMSFFDCTYQMAKKVNLKSTVNFKIDKHSTGGVGDKTSLVLLPILKAIGIDVYKLSGKRLGFTGGTLEKLSTFPNIKINLDLDSFVRKTDTEKLVVAGVNDDLSKFEKKLYTLRSKMQMVDVVGMIVNSVMIKKMILNNDGLILNVIVGRGALLSKLSTASVFAKRAIKIAKKYHRKIVTVFTDMSEPLGSAVGNKVEVVEAINALKGKWRSDLLEVVVGLGREVLLMNGKAKTIKEAENLIHQTVDSGKALESFRKWIESFGGDFNAVYQNPEIETEYKVEIRAWKDGFVNTRNASKIGKIANQVNLIENKIDYEAGIIFTKKRGDLVKKDDLIVTIFTNRKDHDYLANQLKKLVTISERKPKVRKSKILKVLRKY